MKSSFKNETHIEGYVFDHTLEKKVTGPQSKNPNTEYITGVVNVATDEKCENVIPVHYTYITATTSKGGADSRYAVLKNLLDGAPTVAHDGKDKATKVRIDSAIALNEWFRDVKDEKPVSIMRNEGGFIHIVSELNDDEKARSKFKVDMLITNVRDVEADPEKGLDEKVVVRGAIFGFRKDLLPVEFSVTGKGGMQYFRNLEVSNKHPVFTQVWGVQVSRTLKLITTTESAFGDDEVSIHETSTKDMVITGCLKDPYLFDDEDTITAAELSQAMSDRELYLASIKQRQIEYQASKNAGKSAATVSAATTGYDF